MQETGRRSARARWRNVHLGLGLLAGLWFAFLGLTGSLLVFHKEIDALLNPDLLTRQSSAGDVMAISALVAVVAEGVGPVLRVDMPADSGGVVRIQAQNGSAPRDPVEVFIDPGDGRILGTRAWRGNFVAVVYDLHYTLLAGRRGRNIVGFVGLALLASIGSGLYLWWPRGHGFRRALHVKRRPPFSRRVYDIHKSVGLPAVMLLGVSAISGVAMEFPDQTRAIVHAVLPAASSEMSIGLALEFPRRDPGLADAVARARAIIPDGHIRRILMPDSDAGTYRIYLRRPAETLKSGGLNTVTVDALTGKLMQVRTTGDYRAADWFLAWQFPLHNGEAFGIAGRMVVFILGFVPLTLYLTGLLIWWNKRRARRRSARNGRAAEPGLS